MSFKHIYIYREAPFQVGASFPELGSMAGVFEQFGERMKVPDINASRKKECSARDEAPWEGLHREDMGELWC